MGLQVALQKIQKTFGTQGKNSQGVLPTSVQRHYVEEKHI